MARIEEIDPHFLLYRNAPAGNSSERQKSLVAPGNTDHGLRFNKFFGRWQGGGSTELIKLVQTNETDRHGNLVKPKTTNPLLDWLDPRKPGDNYRIPGHPFKTLTAGQPARLTEASRRMQALATRGGGNYLELSLVSRLLIGTGLPHPIENGFLFHPTLGVPYVPGTALKQVARDWAEDEEQLDGGELDRLFGGPDTGVGCIAFLDALPLAPLTLTAEQITNHYPGYYQDIAPANPTQHRDDMQQPADWHEPNPVSLLAVEASLFSPAAFGFGMLRLRGATDGAIARVSTWLRQGLKFYGVGARTTLGFGRFHGPEEQPLAVGDRVRIVRCTTRPQYVGRTGLINKVLNVPNGHAFQLTPDDNAGKLKSTFPEDDVERIENPAGDE